MKNNTTIKGQYHTIYSFASSLKKLFSFYVNIIPINVKLYYKNNVQKIHQNKRALEK